MRIPEKYQELYFFLQDVDEKLINLDKKATILKNGDKQLDYTDKEGISLTHDVRRVLEDIKRFGPYNDMEAIWGTSLREIKENIDKRIVNLESLICEKEKC